MRTHFIIWLVSSLTGGTLMESHETAFHQLSELTESTSGSHMWLLKQADQSLLAIRSRFPEESRESRGRAMEGMRRVVEHVLTFDPPLSNSAIHHIASLMEARVKDSMGTLRHYIATLAQDLLSETGLDILSFDGMIDPPELQVALARVLRFLTRYLGRDVQYQIGNLILYDSVTLGTYAEALEAVTSRYEDTVSRLGFEVQLTVPSLPSFLRVFKSESNVVSERIIGYKDRILRELGEFEDEIVSWARLIYHPRVIAHAMWLGCSNYRHYGEVKMQQLMSECIHEQGRDRLCADLIRMKAFLTLFIERDWSASTKKGNVSFTLEQFLSGNMVVSEDGIEFLETLPEVHSVAMEDGPLIDFPVDSPVLVRIKSSLKVLLHFKDHLSLRPGVADLRRDFIRAIIASVENLNASQLVWLDNYLRDGVLRSLGTFSGGTVLGAAAVVAYELARVCRIKLFDFIEKHSLPHTETIRPILSNLIVTEGGIADESVFAVIKYATNPHLTAEQRALFTDAFRTFTVAHKIFQLRPIKQTPVSDGLGREIASSGFLLSSLRRYPEDLLNILTEYKMVWYAPRRLRLSKLPPFVDETVALLASPAERMTPIVRRIDAVYRQHAQRVAEILHGLDQSYDVGRVLTPIKRLPALIFRQLILTGNCDKTVPDMYFKPAWQYAELLERFPDDLAQRHDRWLLVQGLEAASSIVDGMERYPLELVYDTGNLELAVNILRML